MYIEQYNDFITVFDKLFHIKSDESLEDTYNLMLSIISKYNLRLTIVITAIFAAIRCNYQSCEQYIKILNHILATFSNSNSKLYADLLKENVNDYKDLLSFKDGNTYQIEFDQSAFPKEGDLPYIIMKDQIEKFKEYVTNNELEDVLLPISYEPLSPIEISAYFGSVNIFSFLHHSLGFELTDSCFQLSIIGRNTDIINECMNCYHIDENVIYFALISHNHEFTEYILDRKEVDINKIDHSPIVESLNLKALFLMYEKSKNSIIPWCAAFQQTNDLIKKGDLDFSKIDSNKRTLLHNAIIYYNIDICKFILNNLKTNHINIDGKDSDGKTALHYSVLNNCNTITENLLLRGAKFNAKTKNGMTALHFAALRNNVETFEILISHGADINSIDDTGNSPLHLAMDSKCKEIADILIKHGANINIKNQLKATPLHIATYMNFKDTLEVLLSLGADVNAKDINQFTALHLAADQNFIKVAKILLSKGAEVNSKDHKGRTPLHLAVLKNNDQMAKIIILHGADINQTDNNGKTPLYYAVEQKYLKTAKILISHGANVNIKDKSGRTSLEIAKENETDGKMIEFFQINQKLFF